jgi:hypothetical protein
MLQIFLGFLGWNLLTLLLIERMFDVWIGLKPLRMRSTGASISSADCMLLLPPNFVS